MNVYYAIIWKIAIYFIFWICNNCIDISIEWCNIILLENLSLLWLISLFDCLKKDVMVKIWSVCCMSILDHNVVLNIVTPNTCCANTNLTTLMKRKRTGLQQMLVTCDLDCFLVEKISVLHFDKTGLDWTQLNWTDSIWKTSNDKNLGRWA